MDRPSAPSASRQDRASLPVLVSLLLALLLAACSGGGASTGTAVPGAAASGPAVLAEPASSASTRPGSSAPLATPRLAAQPPADWQGPALEVGALPPEARETLVRIAADRPYPYEQDGSTFQNREGILPHRPMGYYREFTVETPGSPDRGARRFVLGEQGDVYYTDDHYDSFSVVTP